MLMIDADISNGMILQRDTANPITGRTDPGAEVTVRLIKGGRELSLNAGKADEQGNFNVSLPAVPGGLEQYGLIIEAGGVSCEISDVLFGDVYNINGQSNMELPLRRVYDPLDPSKPFSGKVRTPDCPYIREFRVPIITCFEPGKEFRRWEQGSWCRSDSPQAADMSAAGYFFARELFDRYAIPIGLVNTSAGGAPIEAFMPASMLRELGGYEEFLDMVTAPGWQEDTAKEDTKRCGEYYAMLDSMDTIGERIIAGDYPAGEETDLPWQIKDFSGRVWLWTEFDLPEDVTADDPMLLLGTLTDSDRAYINGTLVGETGYMYPPRYYTFDKSLLQKGRNRLAVRLDIYGGEGGFTPGKPWCIKYGDRLIGLSKGWKFAKAVKAEKLKPAEFFQGLPLSLHADTAPVFGRNYKGLIIYQGESNGSNARRYKELFTEYINYYRRRCGREIPVIWAQLPDFGAMQDESWQTVRQAQLECTGLPNTAMAVTIGLGECNDLHPINKWEIGRRLGLCAEELIYEGGSGKPFMWTEVQCSDDAVMIVFGGRVKLTRTDNSYFEAVYPDRTVTVTAVQAADDTISIALRSGCPQVLRYAWLSGPDSPQLLDSGGLPVSPFVIGLRQ